MKKYFLLIMTFAALSASAAQSATSTVQPIQRITDKSRGGTALAVRAIDSPLVFTAQLFATDLSRDARGQAEQALDQIAAAVTEAGGSLSTILRLNVFVAEDHVTAAVDAVIAARFSSGPPAVTLVRSPLATKGALVAFDAVAAVSRSGASVEILKNAAVLPAGGKAFVSGQAQKGKDVAESVQLTMESLHRSLAHIGLNPADVVQVRAFIQPFSDHAAAHAEIAKTYAAGKTPPIVLLEWLSTSPTEIELVAAARNLPPTATDPVAFLSLPGMTTSPLYCRIATVSAGTPLIFLSGIDAAGANAREQWKAVFGQLGNVLFESGSSFRHLVKATYFLADANARQSLTDIRPTYYDPARPPAASALNVTSLGRPGKAVMLDMIAVPAR
jgi:enamine deaminase RidA (YjgF/YER057c/UK114 family)